MCHRQNGMDGWMDGFGYTGKPWMSWPSRLTLRQLRRFLSELATGPRQAAGSRAW